MKYEVVRYDGNEIILTDDSNDHAESFVTNIDALSNFFGDDSVDSVLFGMVVSEASTPDLTVRVSAGMARNVSQDQVLLGEAVTGLVISTPDATQDRYDTIQVQRFTEDTTPLQRQFKDASTGVVSDLVIDTKTDYKTEYGVVTGTPGAGVAPNATSGWVKIAEILVPAGSSTVVNANIYNADAAGAGDSNTGWTAQTAVTYLNGSISDMKTDINGRVAPSGTGFGANEIPLFSDTTGLGLITSNRQIIDSGIADGGSNVPTANAVYDFVVDTFFPVGRSYTQYPGDDSPADMSWPGTWTAQFESEGIAFRTPGGNALAFGGGIQEDAMQGHVHYSGVAYASDGNLVDVYNQITEDIPGNATAVTDVVSGTPVYQHRSSIPKEHGSSGTPRTANESRMRNRTKRVWRRTA